MSKMISARIPDALYSQASIQLASLGASTSDLVNAAFEYVLCQQLTRLKANKRNELCRKTKNS